MNLSTLQQKVKILRDRRIRAQERFDAAMEQLRTTYGLETIDDAKAALIEAEEEIPHLEKKLEELSQRAECILNKIENNSDENKSKLAVINGCQ